MLTPQQLARFERDGFVKGSKVLGDDDVEVLRAETLRVIDDYQHQIARERVPVQVSNLTGDSEHPVWQIVNIWEGSEAFERLAVNNAALVEEVAQIMVEQMEAREIRLFHDQIQFKPAQKGGVNMWHQDSPLWPILEPKTVQLTAWIALDDVDLENGCMSMVPGSARFGDQIEMLNGLDDFEAIPHIFEGQELDVVPCPVEKGAVHYHHPLCWHGSSANRSSRPRRAVALHFMTQDAKFHEEGGHPMKPFVEAQEGETVRGQHFPLVWSG